MSSMMTVTEMDTGEVPDYGLPKLEIADPVYDGEPLEPPSRRVNARVPSDIVIDNPTRTERTPFQRDEEQNARGATAPTITNLPSHQGDGERNTQQSPGAISGKGEDDQPNRSCWTWEKILIICLLFLVVGLGALLITNASGDSNEPNATPPQGSVAPTIPAAGPWSTPASFSPEAVLPSQRQSMAPTMISTTVPTKVLTMAPAMVVTVAPTTVFNTAPTASGMEANQVPSDAPFTSAGPATLVPTSLAPSSFFGSTLSVIVERGFLNCGIQPGQAGFALLSSSSGEYEGFEVDLCRAIAAAVFGSVNPRHIALVPLDSAERFPALQTGDVDVLAAHTTLTMERDVYENNTEAGFTFTAPYLIDGLSFGGAPPYGECADNLTTEGNCTDLRICVVGGTAHVEIIAELIPGAVVSALPTLDSVYDTFIEGFCNAIAGEQSVVSDGAVRAGGFVQDYEQGQAIHAREPLALVTRDGDARWSDMVQWVLQSLLAAEEQGVTQEAAQSFTRTDSFGESFTDLFVNAVGAVGNYGEMYDRHLSSVMPRAGVNMINYGGTGLILSLPFGALDVEGPAPLENSTLAQVKRRGRLKCGITRSAGFAELVDGEWIGLDVDFCKAISAAIFDGVYNDIDFVDLPATERFIELAMGTVDVLSRITTWTLQRDVLEPTSGSGFSFSQPTYYDGLAFGGIPPFNRCADNIDTTSPECVDMKICVNEGTTTIVRLRELFLEHFIVPHLTVEQNLQGLIDGSCNVVFGGEMEVRATVIREGGYTGPYETGENVFSKEPLAIVTRQDDDQFTSFVNWVVMATFFAEEKRITQNRAIMMPTVSLFGPLYGRMLVNAIEAVGNYGEIYKRNVESLLPRDGLNSLNVDPLTPQHYPLPGI